MESDNAVLRMLTQPVVRRQSHETPTAKQAQAATKTAFLLPVRFTTLSGLLPSTFMSASNASLLQQQETMLSQAKHVNAVGIESQQVRV